MFRSDPLHGDAIGSAALRSNPRAMRLYFLAILLALAAGWAAGSARAEEPRVEDIRYDVPGEVPLLAPSWGLEPGAEVLLTDDRLSPRRIELRPGETVRWHSIARHGSRIVFEREVARSMVCHSLVNFQIDGDRLRSAPLYTGDSASFCRLSPGSYRYRVVRDGPAEWPSTGGVQLSSRLEGVIVVLPTAAGVAAR
jgi:hypothetical protein